MAKRTIIKNETIPAISKVLGKTSMLYKTGGNTSTSFNSTDLFNFDVKDEGEIVEKDPQKSYLTTTFYPLLFTDKLISNASSIDRTILTDNLYATHGVADEVGMSLAQANIVVFKKALISIDYYSNLFAKRDAFLVSPSITTLILRDVLRLYSLNERYRLGAKSVSFSMRSVLINYLNYKEEKIFTAPSLISMTQRLYSTKFSSLLIGDSANVGLVVNNDVTMIKDKGLLTWSFSKNMTVDKETRFEENALNMDKSTSYLQSNESLNITSEDGVEIFFEDWIKPATVTKSLLNTYNNTSTIKELPKLTDKIDKTLWTVSGLGFNASDVNFVLKETNSLKRVAATSNFLVKNPLINAKGTTIDLNCTVVGTDRIYLLSNNTTTLSTTVKNAFSLVWYGDTTADTTLRNKFAIVGDDPALIDASSHMIVSSDTYPTGSSVNISVIFYNTYLKLFINGVLQGVKLINRDFNLGEGGFLILGSVPWYSYKATHTYTIKSFRFSNTALHVENSYTLTDPYDLRAVPDISKLGDAAKYLQGLTCGVRYKEKDDTSRVFISVTDSNDQTFDVESFSIDITKWNYIQMANTRNEVTLFVNGVACGSMILPYNIKFKDLIIGSKESNGYMGKMDNFRVFSKIQDHSNPLRSSELFFTQNNIANTKLSDSNPEIVWNLNNSATIVAGTSADHRLRQVIGGINTKNVKYLLNPYNFSLKTVLDNISYKTIADVSLISSPINLTNTSQIFEQAFNLANNSLKVTFNLTNLTGTNLLTIGGLSIVVEESATGYTLAVVIGTNKTVLNYSFKLDTEYTLSFFKIGNVAHIFVNLDRVSSLPIQTVIAGTSVTLGAITGTVKALVIGDCISTKADLISNYDPTAGQGFIATLYEPFKNQFITSCSFDDVTKVTGSSLVALGYNTFVFNFKAKELSITTNTVESDKTSQITYVVGSDTLTILPINKTPLAYFEAITSSQDAILPIPYKIDATLNESVYAKSVLALSSDSYYKDNNVFDRNSNGLAKDVVNIGISKGIVEPGFFFDGTGNYLKVKSDDFAFGVEDFYMEFEVYLNSLTNRAVILDRYLAQSGSWQVSINTDGHLYFTTTTDGSYYFVDVPTGILTKEWYKINISRKGTTIKFYLDDVQVYEYNPGTLINYNKLDVDLHIGYQGTAVNPKYNLNGYLNNIRIVKGLSQDVETDEETLLIEKIKEQPDHKAVTDSVKQLIGDIPWTLDASNNQILYVVDNSETLWQTSSVPQTNATTAVVSCSLYGQLLASNNSSYRNLKHIIVDNINYCASDNGNGMRFSMTQFANPAHNPTIVTPSNKFMYRLSGFGSGESATCGGGGSYTYYSGLQAAVQKQAQCFAQFYGWTVESATIKTQPTENSEGLVNIKIMIVGRGEYSASVFKALNPTYNPLYDEQRALPLATVAQKILSSAELGDLSAKEFVGEKKEVPEQYNIYKSSSDTLFNIFVKDGAFYDYKTNFWTNSFNAKIEVGKAQEYSAWFIPKQVLSSAPIATISDTSEFLLESSFALAATFASRTTLMTLGTLFKVELEAENKGLIITLNGTEYNLPHYFRNEVWYKFAICYKNNKLYVYINDFLYRLPYVQSTWSFVDDLFSILNTNTKYEAIKFSNKCIYKYNKGKENLYLDTHLQFSKNKVDNGNHPQPIVITDTVTTVTNKPFYSSAYESFNTLSVLNIGSAFSVGRDPFSLELDIRLDVPNLREDILKVTNEVISMVLYKDIDNKIKVSFTVGDETTIFENKTVVTINKWFKLNLSRDLGNLLSISVDESAEYLQGFNYDLTSNDTLIKGFTGGLNEVKLFNNYTVTSKQSVNLLKIDFENNTLTPDFVSDVYNSKLLTNSNVSLIKGLSKTSDFVGYFDGASSYMSFGEDPFFNLDRDDFEISFSIYPTNGVNKYQTIIASGTTDILQDSFNVLMFGSTQPSHITEPAVNRIAFALSSNPKPFLIANTQLVYNTWTNVRLERKKNSFTIYINDVADKAIDMDIVFNLNPTKTTLIGKNNWDGTDGHFQGYLDNIKIARLGTYKEITEIDATDGLISGLDFENVGSGFDVIETDFNGNNVDSYRNAWVLDRYDATSSYPYYKTVSAINDAIYFKNKGYMTCHNKHFAMGLDPFTISIDFIQEKRSSNDTFLVQLPSQYSIIITSAGYLEIDFNGFARTRVVLANLDTKYTIAVTRDSSRTVRIFLDGKVTHTFLNINTNYNFGTGTVQPLCLGTRYENRTSPSYVGYYFYGYLDNFIYDRGVCKYTADYPVYVDKSEKIKYQSLVEFKENNVTSFPDLAVPSLQWTSSGITTVSVGNKFTTFSGRNTANGNYMTSTAHALQLGYRDFTVDLIFRPQQTTAETCLLDLSLNTGITEGMRILQHNTSTAAITVELGATGATEWTSMTTGVNTISANKVYHLRVTRNLGTIYIYLDGELKSTQTYEADINIGSTFSLFNNRAKTRGFTGYLEQFRFVVGSSLSSISPFTAITESLT